KGRRGSASAPTAEHLWHDGHPGPWPRQAERAHRNLSRKGVQRQLAAEDGNRARRGRWNRRRGNQGDYSGRADRGNRRRPRLRDARWPELPATDGRAGDLTKGDQVLKFSNLRVRPGSWTERRFRRLQRLIPLSHG